jgi:hypothetical protein
MVGKTCHVVHVSLGLIKPPADDGLSGNNRVISQLPSSSLVLAQATVSASVTGNRRKGHTQLLLRLDRSYAEARIHQTVAEFAPCLKGVDVADN